MENQRPLILVSNDDGVIAKGISELVKFLRPLGEIVVMAPDAPRSGSASALTVTEPIHYQLVRKDVGLTVYKCSGTPVDCIKLALHTVLDRKPDLIVGGINHGDNSAVNVHYSGTMGVVIEGCLKGVPSIGFSLCCHDPNPDFEPSGPYIREIARQVLEKGLPPLTCLNVNFPNVRELKGVKVCEQSKGQWTNEWENFAHRGDTHYYWLTGEFQNTDSDNEKNDHSPSDINRTPVMVKESLSRDQFRLYQLIWKRFTASRMAQAVYETTNVKIGAGEYRFTVSASKIAFDGFMSVYTSDDDEKAENNVLVGSIDENTVLNLKEFDEKQHFTQPPAHYTEASLVKTMEELGIGRPSTYAPTITTIISRRYVSKEQKNLYVTELGEVVNNIMKQAFPSIVDVNFTATMEGLLDCVEAGTVQWKTVVRNFYPDLKHDVDEAEKELEKVDIQDEVTDVICDNCGRNMVIKYGPHGRFLACPGFPDCRNTKPYYEKIGVACPKCGGEIVMKKTKKGRKYYGCENNPECDFMSWQKPSAKKCPKCGNYMLEKGNKLVCSQETCGYVEQKPKDED